MKLLVKIIALLAIIGLMIGCGGDYRKEARGSYGQVIVMMDSTQFNSQTADAIRTTFGDWIQTIPGKPPQYDLTFRDFNSNAQLEQIKRFKNLIVAAPLNDSTNVSRFVRALLSDNVEKEVAQGNAFAFPLEDRWYRNQWTMILTAPTDSALASKITNSEQTLTSGLLKKEFSRWKEDIYDRGEKFALEDSLWQNHGWKIRVQHDWVKHLDTTFTDNEEQAHFLTMHRPLPDNDRWFWAYWKNDVTNIDYLSDDWINAKRDTLMEQWVRGSRDSSYVTTAYERPWESSSFRLNGDLTYETQGIWTMTNDAMAGPFVNFTIYDRDTERLFILEFAQFAPKYDKRRFVRQFRTMLRTFESDSTWQQQNQSMAEN